MSRNEEENDSDIEILDQSALRASFFRQKLRLIVELSECGKRIPRQWTDFLTFVDENISWGPSPDLVRSTWLKLTNVEATPSQTSLDVVEISDEECSTSTQTISAEPGGSSSDSTINGCLNGKISLLGEKSPLSRSPKKKVSRKRKSAQSPTLTEAEANTLREQLLIDKIIELELPKVIKTVMKDKAVHNGLVRKVINGTKRRRRRK